jgi:pyridoxal 5'-phosphate synthase pdxT subunit
VIVTRRIGVLALQGAFDAHARALERLGHETRRVRAPRDLEGLDGLVLPGGESTVQLRLLERFGLRDAVDAFVASGAPVLATCAGLILAAREVTNPAQPSFGWLDVSVARNAWGRQVESFEAVDDSGQLPLVLIRAPRITRVGEGVEVLATLRGEPVLVRQANVTGATFHPELTERLDVHRAALRGGAVTAGGPGRR